MQRRSGCVHEAEKNITCQYIEKGSDIAYCATKEAIWICMLFYGLSG